MSKRSAEVATTPGQIREPLSVLSAAEAGMRELEWEITTNCVRPISVLLQELVERICSLIPAEGAAVAIGDRHGVVCRASTGNAPEVGSQLHPDSALTRECLATGRAVVCLDTNTDNRVHSSTAKSLRLRSAVVVPLQTKGAVLGVLEVLSSRPFAFDATHVARLQHIAELLAPALVPVPIVPAEPAARVLVPLPEEPRSRVRLLRVVGAVFSLLLLLLFVAVLRHRLARTPRPAPAVSSASAPEKHGEQPAERRAAQAEDGGNPQSLKDPHHPLHSEPSSSTGSSFLSIPAPQQNSGSTVAPPGKTPSTEDHPTEIVRPAVPALVIQGAPPGAQIFVDDELVASVNSDGQASISTLAAGQHRLSLKLNSYRDYDQSIDVKSEETSRLTAKLEPLGMPTLSAHARAPILAVAPTILAPVTSTQTSLPDFELDRTLKGHSGWVTTVAFSSDGQRLASGSWDETVKFWDVATGEQLSTVTSKVKEIQALAFSHDGHLLATENSSNTVSLRDATTGREIRTFPSDKPLGALGSNWVYSIAFSPDGQWLATGLDDKTVRLWDVNTGRRVRDFATSRRRVIYIAFSPDGRLLASGDDDKTIRIWDVASGEELQKLSGHRKPVYAVAFSPNGRWLASASGDKTVRLWDVASGREVHTLTGHRNVVTSLAFSPDGRWLVSGSWDKTIKIWEVETGREVQTLAAHDHPIYSVAFDSRGRWLASGSEDGTIKLWRLNEAQGQSRFQR
jgi:WD40 repeat protein